MLSQRRKIVKTISPSRWVPVSVLLEGRAYDDGSDNGANNDIDHSEREEEEPALVVIAPTSAAPINKTLIIWGLTRNELQYGHLLCKIRR